MAQVRPVTSEALEAQIRNLLPSQNGFTEDLQASNVITPIIDLTRAAEGSSTPQILQTALNFGGSTAFDVNNATTTIINNTGFYQIIGTFWSRGDSTPANTVGNINISDGLSTKILFGIEGNTGGSVDNVLTSFDVVVFLTSGDSVSISCGVVTTAIGSSRQIADVNGTLVNPVGFTPQ